MLQIYRANGNYNKKEVEENNKVPNESDTREQLKRSHILFLQILINIRIFYSKKINKLVKASFCLLHYLQHLSRL